MLIPLGDSPKYEVSVPLLVTEESTRYVDENEELHCENGPALILDDGSELYYRHGILHREDGPAHVDGNGNEYYYLDGMNYPKNEFLYHTGKLRSPAEKAYGNLEI
jgi:hypothetical protein